MIDGTGTPLRDVLVEIWQANAEGRYRHPADTHNASRSTSISAAGGVPAPTSRPASTPSRPSSPGQVDRPPRAQADGAAHQFLDRGARHQYRPQHAHVLLRRGGRQRRRSGAQPDRAGGAPIHADRRARARRTARSSIRSTSASRARTRRYSSTSEAGQRQTQTMNARELEASPWTPATVAGVTVRRVPFDAPWAWLAAGWRDMWTVPQISLAYGALFAAIAAGAGAGADGGRPGIAHPGARRRLPADRARLPRSASTRRAGGSSRASA